MPESIIKLEGEKGGRKVAIFGGVHGNEIAGIKVIDSLKDNLELQNGTVYLVFANTEAIEKKVRFIDKNLNRCFVDELKNGNTNEEKRAVELMKILDQCDALLDLHAYSEPYWESIPFAICESYCFDIVKNFDVKMLLAGIDSVEKGGTDGYMFNKGKIGICVELGSIEEPEKFIPLGIKTAYQFLQYFGIVDAKYENDSVKQNILRPTTIYKKKMKNFHFQKNSKHLI